MFREVGGSCCSSDHQAGQQCGGDNFLSWNWSVMILYLQGFEERTNGQHQWEHWEVWTCSATTGRRIWKIVSTASTLQWGEWQTQQNAG